MESINSRLRKVFNMVSSNKSYIARELNVTPSYVWKIFNKHEAIPSERFILDVCDKFEINETWLKTGDGEMKAQLSREDELARLTADLFKSESDSFKSRFIIGMSKLSVEDWEAIERIMTKLVAEEKNKDRN